MQLVSRLNILKGSAFDYISSITYSYVLCGCPGVMSMEGLAYVHHWIYLLTHTVVKCACASLVGRREEEVTEINYKIGVISFPSSLPCQTLPFFTY